MGPAIKDILIRTNLLPGDLGYMIYLHGKLYKAEYQYGIAFEAYVAAGLLEFHRQYDPDKDRVWICEHEERIVGSLLLMHRDKNRAQLRYFLVHPEYKRNWFGKKDDGIIYKLSPGSSLPIGIFVDDLRIAGCSFSLYAPRIYSYRRKINGCLWKTGYGTAL